MSTSTPGAAPEPLSEPQQMAWDAVCLVQAPITVTRLTELFAGAGLRKPKGAAYLPQDVRKLLAELSSLGLVRLDDQGRWHTEPAAGWQRFVALVSDPVTRAHWWSAWRTHMRFDNTWHLEVLNEAGMVGALRVVVFAGGTPQAFERLCSLSRSIPPEHPLLLVDAFLKPFEPALWDALDEELRLRLMRSLMDLPAGDYEVITAPLWQWLHAQSRPDAGRLHQFLRLHLAQRLLFGGQTDEARRVLGDIDLPEAAAMHAVALIVEGQYEAGAQAFEAALKTRTAETNKRKNLLPEPLLWCYAVALLARQKPADWLAARKFVAAEAGKREADPHTFWGIWQAAIDQRLGDIPRQARLFVLELREPWRLPGLQQLSHLLLAAWQGHRATDKPALQRLSQRLDDGFIGGGQQWLALLQRRATALLLDQAPTAADAAEPFPLGAPVDRWREALNAIVALGTVAAPTAGPKAAANRLLWAVKADVAGQVRSIEALEQKAGARGLGKPKAVTLAALLKRNDLPAHDQAVLRAVKKAPFGGQLVMNRQQATLALAGHPHVVWQHQPDSPVEVAEALPRLEVLTRDQHLQFKVLDPIREEDALALRTKNAPAVPTQQDIDDEDDFDDEDDEDDDPESERLTVHQIMQRMRRRGLRMPGLEPAPPYAPVLLLDDGPGRARLVRVTPAQLRVAELISQGWQVPTSARDEIDAALRVLATHFQLASDAEAGHEVPASSVLHAELTPQRDGLLMQLLAAPFGDFGPRLPPGLGRDRVTTVHQGATLHTRRDLAAERQQAARLTEALPGLDDGQHSWPLDDAEQALAAVEALAGLAPGIVTEWPKGKPLRVRPVTAAQVQLRVTSRGDWLSLDGELAVDGDEVLRLESLLELMRQGKSRYVALGNGDFLALTDTLRQQLADLQAISQPAAKAGAGARVATMAALAWAAQPDAPALAGDAAWLKRATTWDQAQQQVFNPPAGLLAELRDYQLAGWRWLMRLAASGFGAVLADDMGLGKTLQTLGLLVARAAGGPALVVAPTSVCGNWLAEAARFAPGLRLALYGEGRLTVDADEVDAEAAADAVGESANPSSDGPSGVMPNDTPTDSARTTQRRQQLQALGPHDVLVCSYGLLQRDAELLSETHWHTVVLDEAQAIKNPTTRRARAALGLQADCRVALTGTPIENRLAELWSIMAFANPGLLGSSDAFQQRFAGPIERDGDPAASRRLRRVVAPFLLRRTKAEVLSDLPPRTEIVHPVVPGSRERALLEALRRQAEDSVNQALADTDAKAPGAAGQAQMHILAALTRLRRAACDPRLVAPELGLVGAKVQAFEQLALELKAGRHKALVFSQFTDFLALLRDRLDSAGLAYQYLDGSTPMAQRTQRVNAFQAGEGDFFLISLKAGGFGLNLTMADYVIIADPWWNPAAEDQASGRAHRIGQQRPVTVYRLVTQGSIEDRIVRLHQRKRGVAEGVLAGQDGGGATLGAAELMSLLRDEPLEDDEVTGG